jgi:hypothetical protein
MSQLLRAGEGRLPIDGCQILPIFSGRRRPVPGSTSQTRMAPSLNCLHPFATMISRFAACTDNKNILKLIVVSAVGNSSAENKKERVTEEIMGQDGSLEHQSLEH